MIWDWDWEMMVGNGVIIGSGGSVGKVESVGSFKCGIIGTVGRVCNDSGAVDDG